MTVVFIFWGDYPGFRDSLACAKARAACPIWVISDGDLIRGVHYLSLRGFPESCKKQRILEEACGGRWVSLSLARWYVLREFARLHPGAFPIFCPDWDVMIFRNLQAAYQPFFGYDYTVSIDEGGVESPAYGVHNMKSLDGFCALVDAMVEGNDPALKTLNDMEAWSLYSRASKSSVGNLFKIRNGTVFDHNMHSGKDRFQFDGPAKRFGFENGYPYFTTLEGRRIWANTFHCWGSFKSRTEEARKLAGIEL